MKHLTINELLQSTSKKFVLPILFTSLFMLLMSGCATHKIDPYESTNRKIHAFNSTADEYVLKPIAQGYKAVVPDPIEQGITNVFANLYDPFISLNQLLQGKPKEALSDLGRFLVNSTIGLFGILDVASKLDLEKHHEDFGQTLATWGVEQGPYIVLPFLGPSNPRDGTALLVDQYGYLPGYIDNVGARNAVFALWLINKRANLISTEKLISGDEYLFIRDAYLQNRDYLINDGEVEDDFLGDDE